MTAEKATMQLGSIFTALVSTMPLMPSPSSSGGYSDRDMVAVVEEANKRINDLNGRLRKVKEGGAKNLAVLVNRIRELEEHSFEVETQARRLYDENVALRQAMRDQRRADARASDPRMAL